MILLLIHSPAAGQGPIEEISLTVERLFPIFANSTESLSAAESDLLFRCGEVKLNTAEGQVFDELSGTQVDALSAMAGDETSISESMTVRLSEPQKNVIAARLQALRGGSSSALANNFDQMSPEPILLTGPITSLSPSSSNPSGLAADGRLGTFINGAIGVGENDPSRIEPGFDYQHTAITAGLDYRITDQWIAGLAIGYSAANADLDGDSGETEVDGVSLSIYGSYYLAQFHLNGMLTAGWRDYQSERRLNYTIARDPSDPLAATSAQTSVNQTFQGDSDATEFSLNLSGGYDVYLGAMTMGPYAGITYFTNTIAGFSETLARENRNDGFGLALEYDDQEIESFTTTIGGMISYAVSTVIGVFSPHIRADWEHEYSHDNDDIEAKFVNGGRFEAAAAENVIIIPTENSDTDFFNLGVGTNATFPYGVSAFADYTTILGLADISYHQLTGGLRFEF